MRLAAIYIDEHEYLFDKPQTINLGGQYHYNFIIKDNIVTVTRIENQNFINGLFDLTKLKSKITNISAIVGQNGAGKSSLLDVIRSEFIEHLQSLPQSTSLFLVEVDGNDYPVILRNDFKKVILQLSEDDKAYSKSNKLIELKGLFTRKIRTIYFSPHFDYKFNPNFDNVDNHDISFDKILESDLNELSEKDSSESGLDFSPSQELIFKNSLRQIEFLSSDLVRKYSIFKDIFHLPDHNDPILIFRGYKQKEKEWNTPNGFRNSLKIVDAKIEEELGAWVKVREIKKSRVENQVEINQYILKRNILKNVISLLYKQMEKNNAYLNEGLYLEDFESKTKRMNALNTLLLFVDKCFIELSKGSKQKVFDAKTLKTLIFKIYQAIDKASDESSVTNYSLKVVKEDAIEILRLQRLFLSELYHYYHLFTPKGKELILTGTDRIEGFINYRPFSQNMSSGENSLLNLFSRLFDFINSNLKKRSRFLKVHDYYLLLLDEADLGFHPTWKKKYVKALISTIPYFFNELENKPSIQIIFTTHDPLTLSDLPNTNVVYIERSSYEVKSSVLDYSKKTFGANISDLLADSFFLNGALIGDFAYETINKTIDWLNKKHNLENADYHKKVIQTIDEPIIQRKLAEMYDDKMETKLQLRVINEQIEKLQKIKKKLE